MAQEAEEIVKNAGVNTAELIEILNKAYADEFLAAYQYFSVVGIMKGMFRREIEEEFTKHAEEELEHAKMLKKRIIELNGMPLIDPKQWFEFTNCGYDTPKSLLTKVLLEQNIKAEQCAIKVYNGIMNATKDLDPVTYQLAREIMEDEIEHEQDLEDYKQDIEQVYKNLKDIDIKL